MSIVRKPRVIVGLVLALLIIANAVVFGERLTSWVADRSGRALAPVVGWTAALRARISGVIGRNDLAAENERLSQQLAQVHAQLAGDDVLRQQVQFYRAAAGIRDRTGREPLEAGIFSYPQGSGVRQVTINRGSRDAVAVHDTVATSDGILIGMVDRLFDDHAIVRRIDDIASEATARILGTDVTGLVRVDGARGLVLDLVRKDETVAEGATVLTSGDDLYPAGLVIGTVRSVDPDAATLFQVIHITPAVPDAISGRVLVIRNE